MRSGTLCFKSGYLLSTPHLLAASEAWSLQTADIRFGGLKLRNIFADLGCA
jgi:hypothetical protein